MSPSCLFESLQKSRLVLPSWLRITATKFSYPQNKHEFVSKKWLTTPRTCCIKTCKNQGWCYRQKGCKLPQQNFYIHKIGMSVALKSDWLCPLLASLKYCQNQDWCYHQKDCESSQQNFHINKIGMSVALKSDWLHPHLGSLKHCKKSRLVLPSNRLRSTATKFSYPQNRHECSSKKWLTTPPSWLIETLQKIKAGATIKKAANYHNKIFISTK